MAAVQPSVGFLTVSDINPETIRNIDDLLTRVRAHGYTVSELEADGLKLKLHYTPDEALSPAEKLTMRRADQDSYGARTARFLGVVDDEIR